MSTSVKKLSLKILKISGITIGGLLLLLFTLPYLFPQTVSDKIKQWAKGSITGQLSFSRTRLSFFKRFPSLTLTLYDFSLKGSAPFQKDTLVSANEISLGIDLRSVFQERITINKVYLSHAFINIQTDTAGHVNYAVYKSKDSTSAHKDTTSASLGIDHIVIEDSRLVYDDRSVPLKFTTGKFDYTGSGDLSKDVFDLTTHTEMKSVDFYYNNTPYILSKSVNADLVTKMNTKSLSFSFQKNDLLINQMPVKFIGKFSFLKNGYDMDFKISSNESDLHDMVTALPPQYLKWLDNAEVKGVGNLQLELAGRYIAADSTLPSLSMKVAVRNGYINYQKSPVPISNLYVNFETKVPGLDPDSLQVNLDSLSFNMGKDYFKSVVRVKGARKPDIYVKVNTDIDLEKWSSASGVKSVKLKGKYSLNLLAKGKFATEVVHKGVRKVDTVITSIPQFTLKSSFTNGYFKYASLPEALKNISFNIDAACPDHDYHHATFSIENFNANALNNFIKGYFKLSVAEGFPTDANLQAKFNLADIKKFYPLDSMDFKGMLVADMQTKGKYIPAKNVFPVTKANISLQNGSVQTKYYPHPIENIQVNTNIYNNTGSLKGLKVSIKPASFVFEGKPFTVSADLKNFNDLEYNVTSHGTIDVGKIYQVFAVKDYNVRGFITTNLSLNGKQSDAVAGHYDKLNNSGTMVVKDIVLTSDLFPKPFVINEGKFSFNQDKMQFDAFKATYGQSVMVLNGALSDVIDYAVRPGAMLKGTFNLSSQLINADDFMAFADASPGTNSSKSATTPSGVIMVPTNLDLTFTADVKLVKYNGLELHDAKGQMSITNGSIILKQTGFTLIGAPVVMDATYSSISPTKAMFDYHINAQNFDIKRAYQEIKLFHDMASAAKSAEGIISLDYKLNGRLNSNMQPVYPSLKGGGVLSVQKVKLKGYKLFGAVGSKTDHNGLDTGDVSKVNIETTIANNIITIKRTKMRMSGFRLRFEGQVSFDNALNLNFRLGLPPFGIFGIPMHITGTENDPHIHLGAASKDDTLKETDDAGN
ncbi:MAG TPA: AsmA-like C-terminal region-containing protein [Mucilaginibacter sp.]|jgi:AsmA protein